MAVGRRPPFVLCYHGVGSTRSAGDPHGLFVGVDLFERHLDVVQSQGYQTTPVGELGRTVRAGSPSSGLASLTFDDGLSKTVREALPMLQARAMRCSMFVPTGLMGRTHPDLRDELIVGPAEVIELAAMGVEIGSHSVDHVRLTDLGYAAVLDQLRRSRAVLEDLLGRPVTTMAYPFGSFDAHTMRAASEAGYEAACACSGPGPWRPLNIPREPVHPTATPLRLRLKMAGLYGPAYDLARLRGRLRHHLRRG